MHAFPVRSGASLAFRPSLDIGCRAIRETKESGAKPCSFMDRKGRTSNVC